MNIRELLCAIVMCPHQKCQVNEAEIERVKEESKQERWKMNLEISRLKRENEDLKIANSHKQDEICKLQAIINDLGKGPE